MAFPKAAAAICRMNVKLSTKKCIIFLKSFFFIGFVLHIFVYTIFIIFIGQIKNNTCSWRTVTNVRVSTLKFNITYPTVYVTCGGTAIRESFKTERTKCCHGNVQIMKIYCCHLLAVLFDASIRYE